LKDIEKKIAPLIEQQFPSFYRDEGANFVAFVKAYYEWMESSNNALYQAKRLTDYRDIDTTTDACIVYFKEKYLKNILPYKQQLFHLLGYLTKNIFRY